MMTRIVRQHLGIWVIAGALLAGLGVCSASPDAGVGATSGASQVQALRGSQTIYQDPTGAFTGYRRGVANGFY